MHGRLEAGLLDRAGWGAILGRKHLPTAFGSFEGKRPKRSREPKTMGATVGSRFFLVVVKNTTRPAL